MCRVDLVLNQVAPLKGRLKVWRFKTPPPWSVTYAWRVTFMDGPYEDATTKVKSNRREITMVVLHRGTHIDNDEEE